VIAATRSRRRIALYILICGAVAAGLTLLALRFPLALGHRSFPPSSRLAHIDVWDAYGGEWTASPAEIYNNSLERGAKLISHTGDWSDYQVQADIRLSSPYGIAGLILRSSGEQEGVDSYHGYFAGIRPTDSAIEFGRADFGWHQLFSASLPHIQDHPGWVHLRVVAVGCTFAVAATLPDGQVMASAVNEPNCIPSGRFGLRSYATSAAWRNISVAPATTADLRAFPPPIPPTNAPDLFLTAPINPTRLNQYISSNRDEARKHDLRPGVSSIREFPVSPGVHPDITIRGVILSRPPLVSVQDDTGAMIIRDFDPNLKLRPGDYIEAHGTVVTESFRSIMRDAQVRVLWSDTPIPPLFVTVEQLTGGTNRGRAIQVDGTLISVTATPGGYELILKDGNQHFRATTLSDLTPTPTRLRPGSRLRLTGIASSLSEFTNDLYPFDVVTERIDVIRGPSWWTTNHILALVLASVLVFIAVQFLLHRLQRRHMRSLLREREELAFEMHDTLAQSFTGIAYQLQAASMETRGPTHVQAHIQDALQLVQMSHKQASRTIAALRPQLRDAEGVLSALKESAERVSDGCVRVTTNISGRRAPLPLRVTDTLFRIGQEAVSNAIQHSGCTSLAISLRLERRQAQLSIEDNGRGFSPQSVSSGLGITAMRSRAARTQVRFDLFTRPGAGTIITVTVPLGLRLLHHIGAILARPFNWSGHS
jgi:signal transduction histidine kinase